MKKILSLALAVMMLVSAVPMVYAADVDYTNGTQVSYTGTGTEAYTVTVPAALDPGDSGVVEATGTFDSTKTLKVTADENVVLTNSINANDTKTLYITFAGIELAGDNTAEVSTNETVAVEAIEDALFGTWSGKFNYNVELVSFVYFYIEGTGYVAEAGMSLEEWCESEYNTIGADTEGHSIDDESGIYTFMAIDGQSIVEHMSLSSADNVISIYDDIISGYNYTNGTNYFPE